MGSRERALDVLVVGLGGGGGRIAAELCRRGLSAVVFHSSRAAAEAGALPEPDRRFVLGGATSAGTGGDPRIGRRLVRDEARRIQEILRAEARGAGMILVTAGLGGGTGSAVAELVDVLDRDAAPVVVLASLPTAGARVDRKTHALRAVAELTRAGLDGLILVDGARLAELEPEASILDHDARANARIVAPLDALLQLVQRREGRVSPLGAERLRSILTSGGVLTYGEASLSELALEPVNDAVHDAIESNDVLAAGFDPACVSALSIIIEASATTLAGTPMRLVEHLREHWQKETEGGSVDVSIYETDEAPRVHVVASCAALPRRLDELVQETAAEARAARRKPRRAPALDLGPLDEVCALDEESLGPPTERPRRVSEVAPRARPERRAHASPKMSLSVSPNQTAPHMAVRIETASPSDETQRDERAVRGVLGDWPTTSQETSPPAIAPERRSSPRRRDDAPGEDDNDGSTRAVYGRLIMRYRSSNNEELRRAMARRLEQDRLSQDAHIRYLAVDAMGKIDPQAFDASLVAATEDDSPAVRQAAERALLESAPGRAVAAL